MLHENPLMQDIDVNHWRNLQSLVLESAKEKRRIILIHEDGEILKFVHSQRTEIVKSVDRVDDPHAVAEKVYRDNAEAVDFVAVFERRSFDSFCGRFQDSWRADEDLDEFVHRTYELMDEYPDGIVTYPGAARTTLGLQWRLGASYDDVKGAVRKFVPSDSTVVFGVFDEKTLWATLILGFDADKRIKVITTVDPSQLDLGVEREALVEEIVGWVNERFAPCSLALFTDLAGAREFLARPDKLEALRVLSSRGSLLTGAIPTPLVDVFPASVT